MPTPKPNPAAVSRILHEAGMTRSAPRPGMVRGLNEHTAGFSVSHFHDNDFALVEWIEDSYSRGRNTSESNIARAAEILAGKGYEVKRRESRHGRVSLEVRKVAGT